MMARKDDANCNCMPRHLTAPPSSLSLVRIWLHRVEAERKAAAVQQGAMRAYIMHLQAAARHVRAAVATGRGTASAAGDDGRPAVLAALSHLDGLLLTAGEPEGHEGGQQATAHATPAAAPSSSHSTFVAGPSYPAPQYGAARADH